NPEEGVEVGACVRRGHGGPGLAVKVCSRGQVGVLVAAGRVREEVANRPDGGRREGGHGSKTGVLRAKGRPARDARAARARRRGWGVGGVEGCGGVGVGSGRFGTVSASVAIGVDPVMAKRGASGITFVTSQVNSRQPSPKDRWMVWSNEKWL